MTYRPQNRIECSHVALSEWPDKPCMVLFHALHLLLHVVLDGVNHIHVLFANDRKRDFMWPNSLRGLATGYLFSLFFVAYSYWYFASKKNGAQPIDSQRAVESKVELT